MIHELPKLDLMEAARRWKTTYDEHGRPLEHYQVFNKSAYRKLQREIGRAGRQMLDDFTRWQVLTLGMSETTAQGITALVWVALYTTGADPIQLLREPAGMRWPHQARLRSGLTRLIAWILEDPDTEPEDRVWARTLAKDMMHLPPPPALQRRRNDPNRPPPRPPPRVAPIVEQDLLVLREVIERRHNREGFRRPWARPVVGLWSASAASAEELVYVEQGGVREALQEYEQTGVGGLSLWGKGKKARVIPAFFILDELRVLANWPAEWGTLADIISNGSLVAAAARVRKEVRETFIEAGIIERGDKKARIPHKNYRRALAAHCYRRTKDWVTVQQMFSLDYVAIKRFVTLPTDVEMLADSARD
jgi:hypothetical protein